MASSARNHLINCELLSHLNKIGEENVVSISFFWMSEKRLKDEVSAMRLRFDWFNGEGTLSGSIILPCLMSYRELLRFLFMKNRRLQSKLFLVANLSELCEKGSPKRFIPPDLVRYIMEFY